MTVHKLRDPTALELLQELLEGMPSSTIIISRASIEAIISKLRKEQNLTQDAKDVGN